MSNTPEQRAQLAWNMIVLGCAHLEEQTQREALLKLVRGYGKALYDLGRERESNIHQQDEMDRQVADLQRQFDRRREVSA